MRVIETNDYRVEYFDDVVYTAEQTIVRVIDKHTGLQAPYKSVALKTNAITTLATYLFADKVVEIDLTEWMRLHASDTIKRLTLKFDTGQTIPLTWQRVCLYDVSKIVRKPSLVALSVYELSNNALTPPSVMTVSAETERIVTLLDWEDDIRVHANYKTSSANIIEELGSNIIAIPTLNEGELLSSVDIIGARSSARVSVREALCGRQYALVRWLFPTGGTVQHLIEVRDITDTTAESYSLRTIDGSFAAHKGAGQSFKLHLDELTAYDAWYYGTIVTSSNVEVSFDSGETWQRVDVTTKKLTQPNGDDGKLAKIDIDVTYSKHSAL